MSALATFSRDVSRFFGVDNLKSVSQCSENNVTNGPPPSKNIL